MDLHYMFTLDSEDEILWVRGLIAWVIETKRAAAKRAEQKAKNAVKGG